MEINPTVWTTKNNKEIQKLWIYYDEKSTLEHFGFNKPSPGL